MNTEAMTRVLEKIREYNSIIITRHVRPDGDAIGSTKGLQRVLQASYPQKNVYVINQDSSEHLSFIDDNDPDVSDEVYAESLAIVLDTASHDRISNKKYQKCAEIIKIDHHIEVEEFGNLSWVEADASSLCEMIATFCLQFKDELIITPEAAKYLYVGLVTDTGRFKYEAVKGNTMRTAGALLDCGIDTELLYAHLDLQDPEVFAFKGYIYSHMQFTPNGVAYVYVDKAMQEKFGLSQEDASLSVSFLSEIKGSIIWIAFIDNSDGQSIRVRLRSRFTTIDKLANKYHGGGHDRASGATVYSVDEMNALLKDADDQIREYKENNGGWI